MPARQCSLCPPVVVRLPNHLSQMHHLEGQEKVIYLKMAKKVSV